MVLDSKSYMNGNENSIISLFQKAFNRQLSYDYWIWRYLKNPNTDTNLINLAWDNNKVVAHYAVSPVKIYVGGKRYNAALSMTTMTDPDYQGRGLFTKLAMELYNNNNNTLDIIFGVPNDNSLMGFTQKLNFKLIKEIPMLKTNIVDRKYKDNIKCVEVYEFDESFDDFFTTITKKYSIIMSRDSKYLTWRFLSNPENDYKIFAYIEEDKVLGYIVVKVYNGGESPTGDIVDVLVSSEIVLRDLINKSFSYFIEQNVTNINTWFSDNKYINVFKEYGFKISDNYFHFIVKNNSDESIQGLFDFENWYLTMSDIDIF